MSRAVPAEVEAKLLVPRAADLPALARLTEVGPWRLVPRGTARLHTRYLDTTDFALARHGVALRVRRHGRRWELTAKWQGSVDGVIHRRPELTVPLQEAPCSPFRLTDPALAVPLAALVAGRPLRVVLISDIQRRLLDLVAPGAAAEEGALAEIALDRVHLHGEEAGGPEQRYCEIEIEQRAGDVADLERVVALLRERFELVPSAETKFSLGMQLLHRFRLPEPRAARPQPGDTVIEAARRLVGTQLAALRAHDPGTRIGADPEALHDMRVAVRRLRAIVRTLHDGFPAALGASLREDLRWFGRELGAVRDLDVQIERVTAFGAAVPPSLRTSFGEFLGHLSARRDAERGRPPLPAVAAAARALCGRTHAGGEGGTGDAARRGACGGEAGEGVPQGDPAGPGGGADADAGAAARAAHPGETAALRSRVLRADRRQAGGAGGAAAGAAAGSARRLQRFGDGSVVRAGVRRRARSGGAGVGDADAGGGGGQRDRPWRAVAAQVCATLGALCRQAFGAGHRSGGGAPG
jgi:inorganic triphosphatase YgiF